MLGEEVNVEGKVVTRSAIYYAKDAQRNLNYWKTCATEAVALAPKTKWLVTPEQIQGFEGQWANANASPIAYLPYNEGHGAPQQVPPATPPIAEMNLAMSAGDDIKRTTGIYDASLGARSNETSGRAIVARQQEGDTATYIFLDNLKKAIEHCGRILLDWIPAVYDTERVVRVLDMEGNPRSEVVNQRQYDPATGVVEVLNSLRLGKYDVVMDAGPSFASRKAEGLAAMTQLAQAYPPLMQLAGDLVVGSMDFPGAEQVAARLKRSIPPQITTDPESEEGQQMQAQQQAQQAQQQQMAQQAMQAKLSVEQGKIEAENAKSQATIAKANADVLKARADTVQTIAEAHSARSEDPQPAPNEPAPPAPQSSSSPGVTIQFNAEHALNGIGQTMTGMANENATAARQQMAVIGQILTATAESTKALVASIEGQRQENAQQTVFLTAALETQRQAAAEQVQAVITALKDQQRLTSDQAAAMQRIGSEAARGNVQVAEAVEELARVMAAPRVPVRDKQGNIVASEIKV